MNKLLIGNIAVLAVAVALLFSNSFTGMLTAKTAEYMDFKVGTFTVCNRTGDYEYCEDKLFAFCNESLAEVINNTFECNMKKYIIENLSVENALQESGTITKSADFVIESAVE